MGPTALAAQGFQACAWEQPFYLKFAGIATAKRAGQWLVCAGDEKTSSFELRLMDSREPALSLPKGRLSPHGHLLHHSSNMGTWR